MTANQPIKKPVKRLTEAERIVARIAKYEAQAAEIIAKANKLKDAENEKIRKHDTRKKIILGAAVQHVLKGMNAAEFAVLRTLLTKHISTRDLEIDGLLDLKCEVK